MSIMIIIDIGDNIKKETINITDDLELSYL